MCFIYGTLFLHQTYRFKGHIVLYLYIYDTMMSIMFSLLTLWRQEIIQLPYISGCNAFMLIPSIGKSSITLYFQNKNYSQRSFRANNWSTAYAERRLYIDKCC